MAFINTDDMGEMFREPQGMSEFVSIDTYEALLAERDELLRENRELRNLIGSK